MNETVFEKIEAAASVLKLDFSSEEFANFAEEQALSEGAIDAVQAVFSYHHLIFRQSHTLCRCVSTQGQTEKLHLLSILPATHPSPSSVKFDGISNI